MKKIKHYVVEYTPTWTESEGTREIESRDLKDFIVSRHDVYALKFYDIVVCELKKNGKVFRRVSKPMNMKQYKIGQFLTIEEADEQCFGIGTSLQKEGFIGVCLSGQRITAIKDEDEKAQILDPSTLRYKCTCRFSESE